MRNLLFLILLISSLAYGQLRGGVPQPTRIMAQSLPLPSGAATSVMQYAGNQSLSNIDNKLVQLTLNGDRLKVDVPAGASGLTDAELRAGPLDVTGTFWQSTQPVSGTFWQATQPVSIASMPSTPVTGTFWQATQPVSIASMPSTPVTGTFWQATQPVSGTFWQATQPVSIASMPSTPVTGTFWQATQPVSIASMPSTPVTGTFWQATQPVSGTVSVSNSFALDATLTGGTQKAIARGGAKGATTAADVTSTSIDVDHNALDVSVKNTSLAVTGTFWQATQPVSIATMPSTPVTGTFWQTTQPVSIASMPSTPVTGTFWQATQPVSGTVSANATLSAETTKVIGTVNISAAQTIAATESGTWTVQPGNTVNTSPWLVKIHDGTTAATVKAASTAAAAADTALVVAVSPNNGVSLGTSIGKTVAMKTGALASSAATADQVVVTYTVTAGKTFYLQYFDVAARLTTFAATATNFGNCSLESPAGTKLYTQLLAGTGVSSSPVTLGIAEGMPIAAGVVIRIVCTPSAVTAMTWQGNLGGYEK